MDCNLCLQKYNVEALTPRILPSCGHTLCEECGAMLLVNGRLTCPFDRMVSVVENGSIQNLPKNFAILELLENAPTPNPRPLTPEDDEISVEEYLYNLQLEAPEQAVGEPEQSHVEPNSGNDDALDDDIDPVLIQEMFGNQAPPIPEQVAEVSRDDGLDDDIDPVFLQEMFDPPPASSPQNVVQDAEEDEIFLQECIYNLGLGGNDSQESSNDAPAPNDVTLEKYIFTELLKCLRMLYDVLCILFSRPTHSD